VTRSSNAALILCASLLLPAAAFAADNPVLITFLEVKGMYRDKRWEDAQGALRRLGELIAAPEHADERPKVLPAFYFYSAAVAFERKDEPHSAEALQQYFALVPNAALDPGAHGKAFTRFFDAQKMRFEKSAAEAAAPPGPQSTGGGVLPDYATFVPDPAAVPTNDGSASWAESPVRFLLTEDEKRAYRGLSDEEKRRDFVRRFWRKLDPRPETPENEFQLEFYRRVQYSDVRFSTEGLRGSLSDRGMVFIVMGSPSYAGRMIMRESDDVMTLLERANDTRQISLGRGSATMTVHRDAGQMPTDMDGEAESWYYRGDRIPKGIPFNEVVFQFVTRKGYGVAVLQKDPRQLTTIAKVQRMLREGRVD
jgi:GWxTD domain-containing protein